MSTPAEELYHRIADNLPDAKKGKMFGALCIKAPNGKAAAMFHSGNMVFKLKGEEERDALSLDGAHVFAPMGENRPMTGWIVIPYSQSEHWAKLAEQSMAYVKALPK